ncbi:uncharacterized protein Dwil_GK27039 [Drosophila willistoni]|uniref:Uncharacterized protein n=1 Tax=Drosophila willistoni TaxID=7260 RepID=A0A0Q9WP39_DROWI|nr:uncharacterized protein Dwil_GK27039 [Drosophila willistoni]
MKFYTKLNRIQKEDKWHLNSRSLLPPSGSEPSLFRRAFGGSSSSFVTSSSAQTTTSAGSSDGSSNSLNLGSNIFKRFAERMRNTPDASPL